MDQRHLDENAASIIAGDQHFGRRGPEGAPVQEHTPPPPPPPPPEATGHTVNAQIISFVQLGTRMKDNSLSAPINIKENACWSMQILLMYFL